MYKKINRFLTRGEIVEFKARAIDEDSYSDYKIVLSDLSEPSISKLKSTFNLSISTDEKEITLTHALTF